MRPVRWHHPTIVGSGIEDGGRKEKKGTHPTVGTPALRASPRTTTAGSARARRHGFFVEVSLGTLRAVEVIGFDDGFGRSVGGLGDLGDGDQKIKILVARKTAFFYTLKFPDIRVSPASTSTVLQSSYYYRPVGEPARGVEWRAHEPPY